MYMYIFLHINKISLLLYEQNLKTNFIREKSISIKLYQGL